MKPNRSRSYDKDAKNHPANITQKDPESTIYLSANDGKKIFTLKVVLKEESTTYSLNVHVFDFEIFRYFRSLCYWRGVKGSLDLRSVLTQEMDGRSS